MLNRIILSVGNTPLIKINEIYAKLECVNPTGSVKDRIARYILEESERSGLLKPGQAIIEATSGNTGIALAYYGREMGHPVIIVMPKNMSEERKKKISDLGAELILCSEGSFAEAARIRDALAAERGYFNPDQFSNPLNVECHYRTTGQEILQQKKSDNGSTTINAFVAGVGTGGTLIGVGKALKEAYPEIYIAAVEPFESPVMSGGSPGLHQIQGIGDGFIPNIVQGSKKRLDELIDEVICISSAEAKKAARYIAEEHGFCVGTSSGANFLAAKRLAEKFGEVVTIFPDGYGKYQSLGLKHCEQGRCPYESGRIEVV